MNETSFIIPGSGEIQQERTLEVIAGEIRTYSDLLAKSAIEIGRRLCEAKEMVPHGQFAEWVKTNTGYSTSSASNFMRLFREFSTEQGSLFGAEMKCQTFGNLNYTKVLALVSLPESERESFVEEHDVEHLSVRELERLVKERTAELEAENQKQALALASAENRISVMQGELESSSDELKKSRVKISELEARPMATVVERDEEAIEAAAEAARKAAAKEYEELVKTADKAKAEAEKALRAAKEEISALRRDKAQLETAAASKSTIDKLNAQYEQRIKEAEARAAEAEKQMKLAAPGVAEFSAAFKRAQTELQAMAEALAKMEDQETRAKLCRAACAVLENFGPKFREG